MAIYTSNLTSQPSWLEVVDSNEVEHVFDEVGLGFNGDNSGGEGDDTYYQIRTNFDIASDQVCTIIFTFIHNQDCADQGIAIFNSDNNPHWAWGEDTSRIAFQYDCGSPEICGRFTSSSWSGGEGEDILTEGETYTAKFIYDPINESVIAYTYEGTEATGESINVQTLNERLPAGSYRIAISADADPGDSEEYSYFTYISISTASGATSCPPTTCVIESNGVKCLFNGACSCPQWKTFNGAYLPAITVCHQRLW